MNAVIVNCSSGDNVAVHRLEAWLREKVGEVRVFHRNWDGQGLPSDADLYWADEAYLSAIFSWDLTVLAGLACRILQLGRLVHIGSPIAEVNAAWIEQETGVTPWHGLHPSGSVLLDRPKMTWTSRGCPDHCEYCLEWPAEGGLVELDDWQPTPTLMDHNFLACSEMHQERTIQRLAEAGITQISFEQGLDAHRYTPAFRHLLSRYGIRQNTWRFTYAEDKDWPAIQQAVWDLRRSGVSYSYIEVFLLFNRHESPQEAVDRAERILGNHSDPLATPLPVACHPPDCLYAGHYAVGWSESLVGSFATYYRRAQLFKTRSWASYIGGNWPVPSQDQPAITNRAIMTLEEVAAYLRVSVSTVARMIQDGELPAVQIGRSWRLRRDLIDVWFEQQAGVRGDNRGSKDG
jgi:excisionase family DNA binding protein